MLSLLARYLEPFIELLTYFADTYLPVGKAANWLEQDFEIFTI